MTVDLTLEIKLRYRRSERSFIERVCLGTNMADSNRCQGKSHVGENQELNTSM